MNITATELNRLSGYCIDQSQHEPVIIEKSNRPFAVMMSYREYEAFMALKEDKVRRNAEANPDLPIDFVRDLLNVLDDPDAKYFEYTPGDFAKGNFGE